MSWRPDPFEFLDYRAFLRQVYEAARDAGVKGYSFRGLAKRAGYSSPNFIKLVIDGKRNLGAASVGRVCRALKLDEDESAYFAELVDFEQADTPGERQDAYDRMASMTRFRNARRIRGELFAYLEHWYLPAIREMAALPSFRADPTWIAENLIPNIAPDEASEALEILFELGLLIPGTAGSVGRGEPSLTTGHEIHSQIATRFHRQMLERAAASLTEVPSEFREISGTTVCVSAETVQRVKAEIQTMRQRLLEICDRDPSPERVYQISFQLFPLSDLPKETP